MGSPPRRIVLVIGWGRSGSTLFGKLLGQAVSAVCCGETRHFWDRALLENRPCACGASIEDCPVWSRSAALLRGGHNNAELAGIAKSIRLSTRTRYAFTFSHSHWKRTAGLVGEPLRQLFGALFSASGAEVLVDTSKAPAYAELLKLAMPDVSISLVHLVRDPRATAYSWRRQKAEPDRGSAAFLPTIGSLENAMRWTIRNVGCARVRRRWPTTSVVVRYEDLVSSPQAEARRVFRELDLVDDGRMFNSDGSVILREAHVIAGNPSRFERGIVRVSPDDEWKFKQSRFASVGSYIFTWPVVSWYGYRLGDGRSR